MWTSIQVTRRHPPAARDSSVVVVKSGELFNGQSERWRQIPLVDTDMVIEGSADANRELIEI